MIFPALIEAEINKEVEMWGSDRNLITREGDLNQTLSKCGKIVEMGKKLNFSKIQPTKPLYKSIYLLPRGFV